MLCQPLDTGLMKMLMVAGLTPWQRKYPFWRYQNASLLLFIPSAFTVCLVCTFCNFTFIFLSALLYFSPSFFLSFIMSQIKYLIIRRQEVCLNFFFIIPFQMFLLEDLVDYCLTLLLH